MKFYYKTSKTYGWISAIGYNDAYRKLIKKYPALRDEGEILLRRVGNRKSYSYYPKTLHRYMIIANDREV